MKHRIEICRDDAADLRVPLGAEAEASERAMAAGYEIGAALVPDTDQQKECR